MGNIPVAHEVVTSFGSLGDVIVGRPDNSRKRWRDYAEESFFGSGIYAAVHAAKGNEGRAQELGRGMGRATGKILCGGGVLKEVPVLHELATCGASLGDMIGGGDQLSARERWAEYKEESVFGSGVAAVIEQRKGNPERSRQLKRAMGRASTKAGIAGTCAAGAVLVTLATAGAGTALAVTSSAAAGSVCGAAATAGVQAVDGGINPADVIGSMLLGGAAGAVGGAAAKGRLGGANSAQAVRVVSVGARSLAPQAMLAQVRAKIRARNECKEIFLKSNCSDAGGKTESLDLNHTSWDLLPGRPDMECGICLGEEEWDGQFRRAHTCSNACGGDSKCCPHEFHPCCLAEWQMACERQGVEFTCPECRAILSGVDSYDECL